MVGYLLRVTLGITTNLKSEAIVANSQEKNENDYKNLILKSFKEIYKKIKPNRWLTVEFHNSKSAIWNAIQESISKAGFIVGQVVIIDKKKVLPNK